MRLRIIVYHNCHIIKYTWVHVVDVLDMLQSAKTPQHTFWGASKFQSIQVDRYLFILPAICIFLHFLNVDVLPREIDTSI